MTFLVQFVGILPSLFGILCWFLTFGIWAQALNNIFQSAHDKAGMFHNKKEQHFHPVPASQDGLLPDGKPEDKLRVPRMAVIVG